MSSLHAPPSLGNRIADQLSSSAETFLDVNPARTDDVVAEFPNSTPGDATAAVDAAQDAFADWSRRSPIERGRVLLALGEALRARTDELVDAMTREQGKPLAESRGEVAKSIEYFTLYGGYAYEYAGRSLPSARAGVEVGVKRTPLGVCALITPWNNPLAIPARKAAPALLAGNTVVLKPSSEAPLCAHILGEAAAESGVPAGVLNVIHGRGGRVAQAIVHDERVRGISFTGSTEVGRQLAVAAGERLVKAQLELGGKNPAIVFDDADLDAAASHVLAAGYGTSGQQCTATSRVLVQPAVLEEFLSKLLERVRALRVAPGDADAVDLGPLVSERQLRTVLDYVEIGRAEGAELLHGGRRLEGDPYDAGWFVEPALFAGVTPDMRIAREEIFGPVVAVLAVHDDEEAIAVANDSSYGLSAAVYTSSLARAHRAVDQLDAGAVAVNLPSAGWEVQTPFGGFKDSGGSGFKEQGREALDFFSELKATQVRYA